MTVHAYASRQHYYDHLAPIWEALPAAVRGYVMGPRTTNPWRTHPLMPVTRDDLVLVASYVDSQKFARHRVVYVEHGAGQTYTGDALGIGHGSYSGGNGHDHTALFICPNETVAARWMLRYPIPAVAVGCPKLDAWTDAARDPEVVGITFHWDNPLVPESRSAFHHYRQSLPRIVADLRGSGRRVIGHGHPRAERALQAVWKALDVPYEPNLDALVRRCGTLVVDNSSAMYEAAAVGVNVVALNASWYRRHVEHGLRFWSAVPGVQVDEPIDVPAAVEEADRYELERLRGVRAAYSAVDGGASRRAAAAIMEVHRG